MQNSMPFLVSDTILPGYTVSEKTIGGAQKNVPRVLGLPLPLSDYPNSVFLFGCKFRTFLRTSYDSHLSFMVCYQY